MRMTGRVLVRCITKHHFQGDKVRNRNRIEQLRNLFHASASTMPTSTKGKKMKKRNVFVILILVLVGGLNARVTSGQTKPTIVIVHGAWGGAWAFKNVEALLRQKGFQVYRPQLTGQGDRVHLARPDIGLNTHIDDVVNTILYEDLHDIILVGHSYGGTVITGVADRVPDRIKRLVYLDAMVPNDGDSVVSMMRGGGDFIKQMTKGDYI